MNEKNEKLPKLKKSQSKDDVSVISTDGVDSPYSSTLSPQSKSPWSFHHHNAAAAGEPNYSPNVILGSLVREEGHIYSLAAAGSDSKNIRVWKNHQEFSGFKSNSGLVKAIVIAGEKIFSGHQDGKIRVWRIAGGKNGNLHKRVGTFPSLKDYIRTSIKPKNYIEVRRHKSVLWIRHKSVLWIRHYDAVSCLSLSDDKSFLYSASWDKTFKVWRIADSKCVESVVAHDDVVGFDGLVFTGSADGTVKVWRREVSGKGTNHFLSRTLLKQDSAVTALAVSPDAAVVYGGSSDGLINFWEREGQLAHGGVLKGHRLAVLCLVTAGSLVLSGADMGICVWRREREGGDHICLSVLEGHSGPVKCLAVESDRDSPPGERRWVVYSGSLDKSVKMWRVSEQAPTMQRQQRTDGSSTHCRRPDSRWENRNPE